MFPEIDRFARWLRCQSPNAATHRHYASDLKLFFAWANKRPEVITFRDVDAYVTHCREIGHAGSTVNRRLAALRAFYRFLDLESGSAPANPVLPGRHFVRKGRRLPRDVGDDDLDKLFAAVTAPRERAMFLLMLRCGLRVCEIHRLSMADLDRGAAAGHPARLHVHGKNDAYRTVYLSPQVLAAVDEWLVTRPTGDHDPALFVGRVGRRLSIAAVQDCLAGSCRRAGVWITCHQFRHAFGRHMVEAGMPLTSIQRLLGHRRLRATQTYLYLSDRQLQAEYDAAMAHVSRWLASDPARS